MENDRVFELLKQGSFNVMFKTHGKRGISGFRHTNNSIELFTHNCCWISIEDCEEIVPWVDKYAESIEKCLRSIITSNLASDDRRSLYKLVTEIETLHNKEVKDGKRSSI